MSGELTDLHVGLPAVVAVLRGRIDELIYENAVLKAAVDQLQTRVREGGSSDAGDRPG